MSITRTYACGLAGTVTRLDNLTTPWVDASTSSPYTLNDIMCKPGNADLVCTIGDNNTILYSTDAGVTWSSSIGSYTEITQVNWQEIWVTANAAYVIGDYGIVCKSTDNFVTFDVLGAPTGAFPTYTLPNPNGTLPYPASLSGGANSGLAIHFIDDDIGVAVYNDNITGSVEVYKTINGGFTWISLNVNLPTSSISFANGIRLSQNQQNIILSGNNNFVYSNDSGITWNTSINIPTSKVTLHLTSYNDLANVWATGPNTYIAYSFDNGITWSDKQIPIPATLDIYGAHFYDSLNGFYSVGSDIYLSNDGGLSGTLSYTNSTSRYKAIWTEIGSTICYTLTNCETNEILYTDTDLSTSVGNIVSISNVVKGTTGPNCWTIGISDIPCDPNITIQVILTQSFQDCITCNTPDNTCYYLKSCNTTCSDTYATSSIDLTPYIGQLVQINSDTNCGYYIELSRQAFFESLNSPAYLGDPLQPFQQGTETITYVINSLKYDNIEYLINPVQYILTNNNLILLDCNGFTCTPVLPNTTENSYSNLIDFLNQIFINNNLSLIAISTNASNQPTPAGIIYPFVIQYQDTHSFILDIDVISSVTGTINYTLSVNSSNVTTEIDNTNLIDLITSNSNIYCAITTSIDIVSILQLSKCPTISITSTVTFTNRDYDPTNYTLDCTSLYCDFANDIYSYMLSQRYGITDCCNNFNRDKLYIQYTLAKLQNRYNESACITVPPPDPCADTTTPVPPPDLGVPCDPPTLAIPSIVLGNVITSCDPPTAIKGSRPTSAVAEIYLPGEPIPAP